MKAKEKKKIKFIMVMKATELLMLINIEGCLF